MGRRAHRMSSHPLAFYAAESPPLAGCAERRTVEGRVPAEVKLVLDRDTGRPRGFAFVEVSSTQDVRKAIEALNGRELQGGTLPTA